jgi:hypothetical protein
MNGWSSAICDAQPYRLQGMRGERLRFLVEDGAGHHELVCMRTCTCTRAVYAHVPWCSCACAYAVVASWSALCAQNVAISAWRMRAEPACNVRVLCSRARPAGLAVAPDWGHALPL